ncbi:hypothetical protein D3C81_1839070 [compost metagenome]
MSKNAMLSAMDPENRQSSCMTAATSPCGAGVALERLTRPIQSSPSCGVASPRITLAKVVLPQPLGPTIAMDSPSEMVRSSLWNTQGSPSE